MTEIPPIYDEIINSNLSNLELLASTNDATGSQETNLKKLTITCIIINDSKPSGVCKENNFCKIKVNVQSRSA